MPDLRSDDTLGARGLKCPMPVVEARRKVHELEPGQVLRVISTDRGSIRDFRGWAKIGKNVEILAQETEPEDHGEIYVHYVQRTDLPIQGSLQ